MSCTGDGWHKVGNCKVLVKDRVIIQCMKQDSSGTWINCHIKKWNNKFHRYDRVAMVTLAAFRSGISRSTMTIS